MPHVNASAIVILMNVPRIYQSAHARSVVSLFEYRKIAFPATMTERKLRIVVYDSALSKYAIRIARNIRLLSMYRSL